MAPNQPKTVQNGLKRSRTAQNALAGDPRWVPPWGSQMAERALNSRKRPRRAPNRLKTVQTGPERLQTSRLSWEPLGPSWVPPHDQPENGSFSSVLCQQFNSGITAAKIRLSERFQTFAKSISAPNRPLWRSRAAKTTFQSSEKLNCAANVEKRLPATRLAGNSFLCERLLPPCKIFLCNAQNYGGGWRSNPVSYVAKALPHSNILISRCPHNNYAGSNTNPDAFFVAQGRETRFSKLCQVNFCSKSSFLVKQFAAPNEKFNGRPRLR